MQFHRSPFQQLHHRYRRQWFANVPLSINALFQSSHSLLSLPDICPSRNQKHKPTRGGLILFCCSVQTEFEADECFRHELGTL